MINPTIKTMLETAAAKALSTATADDINVVPVSMIRVNDDSIWLFNFFMDKTAKNLESNPTVALTAWTETKGVQLKAQVTYHTEGDDFEAAVAWVSEQNPSRVVKGLIVLTPTAVYDISLGGAFNPEELEL